MLEKFVQRSGANFVQYPLNFLGEANVELNKGALKMPVFMSARLQIGTMDELFERGSELGSIAPIEVVMPLCSVGF